MKCTVCNHPRHQDIDLALLSGDSTLEALKQRFGPSRSALSRHKKHLMEKIWRVENRLQNKIRLSCLFRLNNFLDAASETVNSARADSNSRLSIQAASAGTRMINSVLKLDMSFEPELTYRLLASPLWSRSDCLLPAEPQILTDSRAALARSFFSDCPEADPAELQDDDATAAAGETSPTDSRQLAFPGFLIQAAESLPAPSAACRSTAGSKTNAKRDKSEKSARQKTVPEKKTVKYQKPGKVEKNRQPLPNLQPDASFSHLPDTDFETPSLFDRLRHKWAAADPEDNYYDWDMLYEEWLSPGGPDNSLPPIASGQPDVPVTASEAEKSETESQSQPPETEHQGPEKNSDPAVCFSYTADELFEISHGYKKNNPAKDIPNRRLHKDLNFSSVAAIFKKYCG